MQVEEDKGAAKALVTQAVMSDSIENSEGQSTPPTAINGLTGEQWQTLISLLNTAKLGPAEKLYGKCPVFSWIVDSRAFHHMIAQLECFTDVCNIVDCFVGLPNGDQIVATKAGIVVVDGTLKLTNVLYVPRLNCNLISVSKLTKQNNCIVQFTDESCVIQDCISRVVIGAGKQREGLYYLQEYVTTAAVKTKNDLTLDLWHKWLGHASFGAMKLLSNMESSRNNDICNKACEICLRAKQSRGTFSY